MWLIEVIILIIFIAYFAFGFFTFYWAITGYPTLQVAAKATENETDVSKRVVISSMATLMYHHGRFFIMGFVILAILLFAFAGGMVVARSFVS